MPTNTTELLLRVNGIQAAFGIELGFASPRADEGRQADPYRQANTSFSLVQLRDGQVVRHTLIDVGMGVVPSLLDFEVAHGFVAQLNCPGFAQQKCVTTWKEERGSFFQVEVVRGDLEDGAGAPRARRAGRAGCRESGVGAGCALGVR